MKSTQTKIRGNCPGCGVKLGADAIVDESCAMCPECAGEPEYWTVDFEKRVNEEFENDFRVFTDELEAEEFAADVYGRCFRSDAEGNPVRS